MSMLKAFLLDKAIYLTQKEYEFQVYWNHCWTRRFHQNVVEILKANLEKMLRKTMVEAKNKRKSGSILDKVHTTF